MLTTGTKRILAIDNDPNMQKIIRACLTTVGRWDVQLAASVEEGLSKAEMQQPDAILLEGMIPMMNVTDFLVQLQANPSTQAIPVIFLTERIGLTERQRFLALGAVGAIAKPFDPLTLAPKIAAILGWTIERSANLP
jgi:CheY-like chemotaxis protein